MIKKIVSGGQTGADRAALDAAIELGIAHGGWLPRGRKTEDGILPDTYQLQEMPTDSYPARTEKNVLDSDGTLIVSHGDLTGGSLYTQEMAMKHGRPCLHIDLTNSNAFKAATEIHTWITRHGIKVLNVAGPRASEDPAIYEATVKLLKAAFYIEVIDTNMPDPHATSPSQPHSVREAVERLTSEMPLKDKTSMARMNEHELSRLEPTLGRYIKDKFGLWSGNSDLIKSCRYVAHKWDVSEDDASAIIIKELWKKVRNTHLLRTVK